MARNLDLDLGAGRTRYRRASLTTSTYMPNFIEIKETFVDGRAYGRTFETGFIRSTLSKSRPIN